MISTSDFKTGLTILYDNNIYQILEFMHVKPGKGAAFVRTKLRNLRSGAVIDHTFNAGVKVDRAQIDKLPMQYLYQNGDTYTFMNAENYEQIELTKKQIEHEIQFIYEGMTVEIMFYDGKEMLGVSLPDKVTLEIVETMDAVKGDTKTNAMKDATLQTGLVIKVPMFIAQGERVIVSTYDGTYVSREK
jgi:elongation factor P